MIRPSKNVNQAAAEKTRRELAETCFRALLIASIIMLSIFCNSNVINLNS